MSATHGIIWPRLIALIVIVVIVVSAVIFIFTRGSDDPSVVEIRGAQEGITEPQALLEGEGGTEVTSLFGQATQASFAAAQTVQLQEGTVEALAYRSPSTPGFGEAEVAVRVGIYQGDVQQGFAGLTELGSAPIIYTRTEQAAVREVVFDPPIEIPETGEYVVAIGWVSAVPDTLDGFEPITVLDGDVLANGRGFNLRSDGVTNEGLWQDLDYLVVLRGSAVPQG